MPVGLKWSAERQPDSPRSVEEACHTLRVVAQELTHMLCRMQNDFAIVSAADDIGFVMGQFFSLLGNKRPAGVVSIVSTSQCTGYKAKTYGWNSMAALEVLLMPNSFIGTPSMSRHLIFYKRALAPPVALVSSHAPSTQLTFPLRPKTSARTKRPMTPARTDEREVLTSPSVPPKGRSNATKA